MSLQEKLHLGPQILKTKDKEKVSKAAIANDHFYNDTGRILFKRNA